MTNDQYSIVNANTSLTEERFEFALDMIIHFVLDSSFHAILARYGSARPRTLERPLLGESAPRRSKSLSVLLKVWNEPRHPRRC